MDENDWGSSSLISKVDENIFQGNPLVLPVVNGDEGSPIHKDIERAKRPISERT